MAVLHVARMGNPVLREIAQPVPPDSIRSKAFQQFCEDLLESMIEHDGTGLAAPQVHESVRVVVFSIDGGDPIFLINPVITPLSPETAEGYEGCLSVPNLRGKVQRWSHIRVDALNRAGKSFAFEAHGWPARVVQHECDHLDGVLYVDRADPKSLAFLGEYRRFGPPVPLPEKDREDEDKDEDADEGEE
jgi:peptide deformylase